MRRLAAVLCALLVAPACAVELQDQAAELGREIRGRSERLIKRPRQLNSRGQMEAWLLEEMRGLGVSMAYALLDSDAWDDYFRNRHFVPMSYDGLPEGRHYDFHWSPKRSRVLPYAEITEDGKFWLWWQVCNYYGEKENKCRETLRFVIKHELLHYRQWLRARAETATHEDFLKRWRDGRHFQCREVEAYGIQLAAGDIRKEDLPRGMLRFYYRGCAGSIWKDDFRDSLNHVRTLLRLNKEER